MKAESRSGNILLFDVYSKFSGKKSPYRIFGKRRMSTILKNGEGIFWQTTRNGTSLRLKGKDTVARILHLEKLQFKVVKLEIKYLLQGLKETRAAFLDASYASFDNPISRIKIEELTGISISYQKDLEKTIKIKNTPNIAVAKEYTDEHEQYWDGKFTFNMYDRTGKVTGQKGAFFLAEKLPNTYHNKQCKAGQRGRTEYNSDFNSRQKLTGNSVQSDSQKRLYSTSKSKSKKAKYEKAFNMLTGSTRSRTKIGSVGVFYNMEW